MSCSGLIFWSMVLCANAVLAAGPLSTEALRGREIYRRGTRAGADAGTASIGTTGVALPTSTFACSNCHGLWGEGSREGGVETSPLNWNRLTSPAFSPLTGRRRGSYSVENLRQAIANGRDPTGATLHPAMPRFNLPPGALSEIISYLQRIGDPEDIDPGVSVSSIRIGAALPLSGPLAEAGQSIRATLEQLFSSASRDGGIFGRSIELVVEDAAKDAPGQPSATRRLMEDRDVFALAANLEPNSVDESAGMLRGVGIPLIGPVTHSPHQIDSPNPYVFYLLPSLYDQARALVDFIAAKDAAHKPSFAIIHADTTADQVVVQGLRRQAALHGLQVTLEQQDSPGAVAAVLHAHPDYLLFSGDGSGLARIAKQLDSDSAPVLAGFLSTSQSGVKSLPPRVAARALLAAPSISPDTGQLEAFLALASSGHPPPNFSGLRASAFAAGTVLIQALRSNGSRLSRDSLIRTLEGMQHFETGVTAPLTFGPNQRVGSSGATILVFDSQSQSFVPASDWLVPKN